MHKHPYLVELKAWVLLPAAVETVRPSPVIDFKIEGGKNYWLCEKNKWITDEIIRTLLIQNKPVQGAYWFRGKRLAVDDHSQVLDCRRQIGCLSSDTALMSNKTLRENILLQQQYFNNDLSLTLSRQAIQLCSLFNLKPKLDLRPAQLSRKQILHGIFIREILKNPNLMILAYPEETIGERYWNKCLKALKSLKGEKNAILLISQHGSWADGLGCRPLHVVKIDDASA
jgi:ABC-type lipoprotein export system ATPase subunit